MPSKYIPIEILEDGMKVHARDKTGRQICGWVRTYGPRKGEACESPFIIFPAGRCRKHGGNNKRGAEHHEVRAALADGRLTQGQVASRYGSMGGKFGERFQELLTESLKDNSYLSFREDIAFTDAYLGELTDEIGGMVSEASLKEFGRLAEEIDFALEEEDHETLWLLVKELVEKIRSASTVGAKIEEVRKTQEHRTKLANTERQIIEADSKHIAREEAFLQWTRLLIAVREVVTDKKQLDQIHRIYRQVGLGRLTLAQLPSAASIIGKDEEEEHDG